MTPYQPAGDALPDILELLDLPRETEKTAQILADVVGDPTVEEFGDKAPRPVATACIYVADSAVRNDNITQNELLDDAPGSHMTLRSHYQLIPAVFLENATGEQLDELPDVVLGRIKLFRDAVDLGLGIRDLDPWTHSVHEDVPEDLGVEQ